MTDERTFRVAIVDDEPMVGDRLVQSLTKENYRVEAFTDPQKFLGAMEHEPFDVVFTDLRMPRLDGMTLLAETKRRWPATEVVVITAFASIESAIEATRKGAYYYLSKPLRLDDVRLLAKKAVEKIKLVSENQRLREQLSSHHGWSAIIGVSPPMKALFEAVEKVAPLDCNVLIQGESGSGKELVARALHSLSPRRDARFVCFNCGGFSEELVANELFGHEKDAFTGASSRKIGLLEAADGGTVFLDEISEMPTSMQVKLLRVIQERQILRVGGTEPVNLDLRIITATNRDIKRLVQDQEFREDLYYRINVVTLQVPPLARRRDDIPLLVDHFRRKYSEAFNKKVTGLSAEARQVLMNYAYPGNVRELENIVERSVALCDGETIEVKHLPWDLVELELHEAPMTPLVSLDDNEKAYIAEVLQAVGGNRSQAAKILDIPRTTLWRKMKRYGLGND